MENNSLLTKTEVSPEITPLAEKILLAVIIVGYPVISMIMYYLFPSGERVIESRIIQIYLPGLIFQLLVISNIVLVVYATYAKRYPGFPAVVRGLASLGIKRRDLNLGNLFIALAFLMIAIIVLNITANILDYYNFFQAEDITYMLPRTPTEKIFWASLSLAAGITEEICFRGFVISRMAKLTGHIWPGVILGSVSFGLGHLYQGIEGVTLITIYGIMFGLLYLARGSVVPCMIAHTLQDILAMFAF